jgi:hypothetical protein
MAFGLLDFRPPTMGADYRPRMWWSFGVSPRCNAADHNRAAAAMSSAETYQRVAARPPLRPGSAGDVQQRPSPVGVEGLDVGNGGFPHFYETAGSHFYAIHWKCRRPEETAISRCPRLFPRTSRQARLLDIASASPRVWGSRPGDQCRPTHVTATTPTCEQPRRGGFVQSFTDLTRNGRTLRADWSTWGHRDSAFGSIGGGRHDAGMDRVPLMLLLTCCTTTDLVISCIIAFGRS